MSDPLKPRIDFARPLDESSSTPLRPAQTFEAEAQAAFLAVQDEEVAVEEEGAGERAVEAALKPKRSLWRKLVTAGALLFGVSVIAQVSSGHMTPGWPATGFHWAAAWRVV